LCRPRTGAVGQGRLLNIIARPQKKIGRSPKASWQKEKGVWGIRKGNGRFFFAFDERQSEILLNCRCQRCLFQKLKTSKTMIKYSIYCRKSSEDEKRQILSIETQLAELQEFAKQNNLFIVREFTESKTAKEPRREIFNQMLSEIEKGNASWWT